MVYSKRVAGFACALLLFACPPEISGTDGGGGGGTGGSGGGVGGGGGTGGSGGGGGGVGGGGGGGTGGSGGGVGGGGAGGGGGAIGQCSSLAPGPSVVLATSCPPSLPSAYGGTIASGTYQLTGAIFGPAFTPEDGGTFCSRPHQPSHQQIRILATSAPRTYDYEMVAAAPTNSDGGGIAAQGSSRGQLFVTADGQSLYGVESCTDGGYAFLPEPRLFIATATGLSFDCCRSSVVDAGELPSSINTYMTVWTKR